MVDIWLRSDETKVGFYKNQSLMKNRNLNRSRSNTKVLNLVVFSGLNKSKYQTPKKLQSHRQGQNTRARARQRQRRTADRLT